MKRFFTLSLSCFLFFAAQAQEKTLQEKLKFTADFRFRVEEDWDSRKSDGSYRDNRTRFRYRARFGFNYQHNEWAKVGMRIRTGLQNHQQDPQLTLGTGYEEFGTLPIGFEKIFFQANHKWLTAWAGKNTFPFEKQNELFWSDNVYPEGVYFGSKFPIESPAIGSIKLNMGHFIVSSAGKALADDRYFQGIQVVTTHFDQRLKLYPSFYYFNRMPDIPDDKGTYELNYSIFHLGAKIKISDKPAISVGLDYYNNLEDLGANDSIPAKLKDQKRGLVGSLIFGNFEEKGDWTLRLYYTYLERYAAVDFLAQNDWTRWDYSNAGSPAGRLTNFKGVEFKAGYVVSKNFKVNMRYFVVEQILPYGDALETGNRVRFDLDIGF
ncbi:putative porin [Flammeovirgaceae bacterium SG7u.111]|nr:putative porin [Flammeovirgaceae bacterium SG7u.132]WPO36701.1 putative porin [Flammeovirgaceae bacterium SG7u.111]